MNENLDIENTLDETLNEEIPSEISEKQIIDLKDVNLYSTSSKSRRSSTITGTYSIDSTPVESDNGRIKIYDPESYEEVGWVNYKDIFPPCDSGIESPEVVDSELVKEVAQLETETSETPCFKEGDLVKFKSSVNTYADFSRTRIPDSIKNSLIYVRSKVSSQGQVFVSPSKTGAVSGVVYASDLIKVSK